MPNIPFNTKDAFYAYFEKRFLAPNYSLVDRVKIYLGRKERLMARQCFDLTYKLMCDLTKEELGIISLTAVLLYDVGRIDPDKIKAEDMRLKHIYNRGKSILNTLSHDKQLKFREALMHIQLA